jgi:hypothetical protein
MSKLKIPKGMEDYEYYFYIDAILSDFLSAEFRTGEIKGLNLIELDDDYKESDYDIYSMLRILLNNGHIKYIENPSDKVNRNDYEYLTVTDEGYSFYTLSDGHGYVNRAKEPEIKQQSLDYTKEAVEIGRRTEGYTKSIGRKQIWIGLITIALTVIGIIFQILNTTLIGFFKAIFLYLMNNHTN